MALRDQPYLPLYIQDFLTDEKLIECSASSTGVYIRLMCIMHKSEEYGTILLKQKDKQTSEPLQNFASKIAKQLPYTFNEIYAGLDELINEGVLIIDGDKLSQKRMVKDNEISTMRAKIGREGGLQTQRFAKAKRKAKCEANTENENEDYSSLLKKVLTKNSIQLPEGFEELILEWLQYKSEKRQSYKETGLKTLIKTFLRDANYDKKIGREMLDYSMSKNYSGLFKEKVNGKPNEVLVDGPYIVTNLAHGKK